MMNGNYSSRVLLVIRDLYERVTSHAYDGRIVSNNREIIQYNTDDVLSKTINCKCEPSNYAYAGMINYFIPGLQAREKIIIAPLVNNSFCMG